MLPLIWPATHILTPSARLRTVSAASAHQDHISLPEFKLPKLWCGECSQAYSQGERGAQLIGFLLFSYHCANLLSSDFISIIFPSWMEVHKSYMRVCLQVNLIKVAICTTSVQWKDSFLKIIVSNILLFQNTKDKLKPFLPLYFLFFLYLYEKKKGLNNFMIYATFPFSTTLTYSFTIILKYS